MRALGARSWLVVSREYEESSNVKLLALIQSSLDTLCELSK